MCLFLSSNYGENQVNPMKNLLKVFLPSRQLPRSLPLKGLEKDPGFWEVSTAEGQLRNFQSPCGIRRDKGFMFFLYPQTHRPLTPGTLHITIAGIKAGRQERVQGDGLVMWGEKRQKKIDQQETGFFFTTNLSLMPPRALAKK